MQQNSPLVEMISKRGMTNEQALKACGLSRRTFEILLGGGVTLPQLALKVGKALKLTQEEVKLLGKPLDKASWDAKKLPYKPIDVDPSWFKCLRGKCEDGSDEIWLNREALLQRLLDRGIDQHEFYTQHPELRNVNQAKPENRRAIIRGLERELDLPEGKLAALELQKGQMETMYLIRKGAVEAAMHRMNMTRIQMARAMWTPDNDGRMPSRRMSTLWQKIEAGEPVSRLRVEAVARVLEVEVAEIAEVTIRVRKSW